MLRGMGFDRNTSIYLASGKIYDAERNMAPLFEMFPLLQTKEMLASPEELTPYMVRMLASMIVSCALFRSKILLNYFFLFFRIIPPGWLL